MDGDGSQTRCVETFFSFKLKASGLFNQNCQTMSKSEMLLSKTFCHFNFVIY
jgi:hypothetical protein